MLRLNNLDESLKSHRDKLEMKLLHKHNLPGDEFTTLAFVGYDTENETVLIESTWNWRTSKYELGAAGADGAASIDIYQT
jgi:hypothetical protein